MNRRSFIKSGLSAGISLSLPFSLQALHLRDKKTIRIGLVADVHQDVIHDAYERISLFIDEMNEEKPDFIVQLGDFALPRPQNQVFLDAWNKFEGSAYHVLGNHDMRDYGFTREETMQWWGMEKPYYSFDKDWIHFIVLDGNDPNPKPWSGYDRYIGETQQQWLKKDLAASNLPTIVFVHQSLEHEAGVANADEILTILEAAKINGQQQVIACFTGHHHTDYSKKINNIYHVQINSMSYRWVGSDYQAVRFGKHIEEKFQHVKSTCPYKDPLYTVLTIDPVKEQIHLRAAETTFIPPTPHDLNMPNADELSATITEQKFTF